MSQIRIITSITSTITSIVSTIASIVWVFVAQMLECYIGIQNVAGSIPICGSEIVWVIGWKKAWVEKIINMLTWFSHYTFFDTSNSEISKWPSDISKWYSDFPSEFQTFSNEIQKFTCEFQIFPNEIKVVLII